MQRIHHTEIVKRYKKSKPYKNRMNRFVMLVTISPHFNFGLVELEFEKVLELNDTKF
jgi:hypothetical protein